MATQITQPDASQRGASSSKVVTYDHYIDGQIRKTSNTLKAVDVALVVVRMLAAVVGYLLVAALFDHWLIGGGLSVWGRAAFAAGLAGICGYFLIFRLAPLGLGRINPIYSAQTIERSSPTLKNSLLNFLWLRNDRQDLEQDVYETVEEQAARKLSRVRVDIAVDRSRVIQAGYVLLGVVIAYCLYLVFSPKDPLASARRVVLPWADIKPSTRVTISDVEPGVAQLVRGEPLEVSAQVAGLNSDEPITLYYSTSDGQAVDVAMPMHVPAGSYRYKCVVPESGDGVFDPLVYWIEAGDARTQRYAIDVVPAPTIVLERVEYAYPEYTRFSDHAVEGEGDVKAIEGTRVTLRARANSEIDHASIDFENDGRGDIPMRVSGQQASATFTLVLKADRRTPLHPSYSLRFTNRDGRHNREPVEYRIEVTPDLPPEVVVLSPQEELVEVPHNGSVEIEVQAVDPDFALDSVELRGAEGDRSVVERPLLTKLQRGRFSTKYRFQPAREGLKVGQTIEYWAEAEDNKDPRANRAASKRRKLRVTSPDEQLPGENQVARNEPQKDPSGDPPQGKPDEQPNEGGSKDDSSEPGQKSESGEENGQGSKSGEGEQGQGQPGGEGDAQGESEGQGDQQGQRGKSGKPKAGEGAGEGQQPESVANDGSQDGEAIERIQQHLDEDRGEQSEGGSPQQGDNSKQGEQQPGDPQAGDQGGERGQDQQQQAGEQQPTSDQDNQNPGAPKSKPDTDGTGQGTRQKPEPNAGEQGQKQPGAGEKPNGEQGKTGQPDGSEGQPQDQTQGSKDEQGQTQGKGQDAGKSEREGEKPSKGDAGADEPKGKQPGSDQGEGAQSKRGTDEKSDKPMDPGKRPEAKGGDGNNDKGDAGSGRKGSDDSGSPEPQTDIAQRPNKNQQPGDDEGAKKDKAKSPAHGKKESDSDGSQGGDKPGGGEEGGGQKANRQGTGSAGQNTAADEGGGQSTESGEGDTSDRGGDDVKSDEKTGKSAQEKDGQGTGTKPKGQGDGQQDGQQPNSQPSQDAGKPGQQGEGQNDGQQSEGGKGRQSGTPGGGTETAEGGSPAKRPSNDQPGDDPNLEYARKATDLVLEKLEHDLQQDQVDQELLDGLGWSKDDLRRFVDRVKKFKGADQVEGESGAAARREQEDWLRSLGLRRDGASRGSRQRNVDLPRLRESHRIAPPADYAEQVRAYKKSLSTSRPKER